ncbi:hypothetical protein B0B24_07665 [Pseudomonas aeruginosa]|nr:hypothetical protein B0B24_07665 [Pseudomonas aeruginosa]ONM80179.1 hypothetical protein B0B25_14235 [Pseudomonas aeruginosa]OOH14973.1 hypothetical protein B0B33_07980 [Pseudomonas aeruginosa]
MPLALIVQFVRKELFFELIHQELERVGIRDDLSRMLFQPRPISYGFPLLCTSLFPPHGMKIMKMTHLMQKDEAKYRARKCTERYPILGITQPPVILAFPVKDSIPEPSLDI